MVDETGFIHAGRYYGVGSITRRKNDACLTQGQGLKTMWEATIRRMRMITAGVVGENTATTWLVVEWTKCAHAK